MNCSRLNSPLSAVQDAGRKLQAGNAPGIFQVAATDFTGYPGAPGMISGNEIKQAGLQRLFQPVVIRLIAYRRRIYIYTFFIEVQVMRAGFRSQWQFSRASIGAIGQTSHGTI